VLVRRIPGVLHQDERETAIGWTVADTLAEVTTAEARWKKRIESLGYKPEIINLYEEGGEIRVYDIPKRLLLLPSRAASPSKAALKEAEETWERRAKLEREAEA
jgi:hypothetical protein